MRTLFIADLHLSEARPDITAAFVDFLATDARHCDALYILGDLFEVWIGDDDRSAFNHTIEQALATLTEHGTPCYFIHGNRDFLVGRRFAERSGVTLLPEQMVVDLYGEPTLIMHGDSLCTRDDEYMRFRRKARGWWWPRLMLTMPLWYRRRVARQARQRSAEGNAMKSDAIMDVTPSEVLRVMKESGVRRLIHGHTHRPAIHHIEVNNQPASRIVLGDWYEQSSVLIVDPEGVELRQGVLSTTAAES